MSLELIIILVLAALLVFSVLKRVIWLALVAIAIGTLIYFGWFDLLFEFVRTTIIEPFPIVITVG